MHASVHKNVQRRTQKCTQEYIKMYQDPLFYLPRFSLFYCSFEHSLNAF